MRANAVLDALGQSAPVIVKPVEVASIGAAPGEVSRSWVFKKSSIGEFFILRIGPGAAAVARVGAGWMAVDRSVDTVKDPSESTL